MPNLLKKIIITIAPSLHSEKINNIHQLHFTFFLAIWVLIHKNGKQYQTTLSLMVLE